MLTLTKKSLWLFGRILSSIWRSLLTYVTPAVYKSIEDDVILITGGGRGIGRKLALEFAKFKPRHIVLWGRTEGPLQETMAGVRQSGVNCTYMLCDVSDKEQVYSTAQETLARVGVVTILVNNAGVVYGNAIVDAKEEEVIHTLKVNLLAHIWTLKSFVPGMLERGQGHVVTVSSMLGLMGLQRSADYCASKFGTLGLTEALRLELACHPGLQFTSVHPYLVDNQMFAGLKVRFPRLFPALSEQTVAERTVAAVRSNQKLLLIPRSMYFLVWFQSWSPVEVMLPCLKFLGIDHAMDHFQGHHR